MRAARSLGSLVLLTGLVSPAFAQNPQCQPYAVAGNARRVCDAAVDATRAFHPVAGLLVSGGNPVIGSGGVLGGLGHASFTVRANATELVLPDLSYDGSSSTVASGQEVFAAAPLVEGAVGLYPGTAAGFLGIDLLLSAQLLPTDQIDNFSIDGDARRIGDVALGIGYGVRIGLLKEMGPLPGVSVSVLRRDIPRMQYGNVSTGDDFAYAVDLQTTNVRVTAGKRLAALALAGGLGWDKYTGDASARFRDPLTGLPSAAIDIDLSTSRFMAFANAGFNIAVLKVVGEAGWQAGKDQDLTTDFEGFDPAGGRFFAGLGIQVAF